MEWERSRHAQYGVGCIECHGTEAGDIDGWKHQGSLVTALVTPKDCARCHEQEYQQFTRSHHAKAGQILASLDNVLAEKVAGMPGNNADAVNGCWQCHGTIVKFLRDKEGKILRTGKEGKPVIDPTTWPNSGMGRMNPDGSQGSCHACHSRHSFQAKLSRAPENCGKCHMGPDHPQIEIYNESKHGIAFYANRDSMALDKEDYPADRPLPKIGDMVATIDNVVENERLVSKTVKRKVELIISWEERRKSMKGACLNCHNDTFVDNFYKQFEDLVLLFNEKFAKPATKMIADLTADSVLKANAPFEHEVQWVYWELWHHEGRRARHGASMMGPDYTHWHGMYEVSKNYYTKFLPEVIKAAGTRSAALKEKYEKIVAQILMQDEHIWMKGLSPGEAEELRKAYKGRYNQ